MKLDIAFFTNRNCDINAAKLKVLLDSFEGTGLNDNIQIHELHMRKELMITGKSNIKTIIKVNTAEQLQPRLILYIKQGFVGLEKTSGSSSINYDDIISIYILLVERS